MHASIQQIVIINNVEQNCFVMSSRVQLRIKMNCILMCYFLARLLQLYCCHGYQIARPQLPNEGVLNVAHVSISFSSCSNLLIDLHASPKCVRTHPSSFTCSGVEHYTFWWQSAMAESLDVVMK
jgi:hypothetical protein